MTLDLKDLAHSSNGKSMLKALSLSFQPGLLYGILGPNGSGKTTLLKLICRIWNPIQGKIFWKGVDMASYNRRTMSQICTFVPQNPSVHFDFDVHHFTAMGQYPHNSLFKSKLEDVEQALRKVDAWHLRDRIVSDLSGGEIQRVYIARALVTQAPVMLLDEPTSHLDLQHQLEIWDLLQALAKEGKLIIAATHDLSAVKRFCDRLVVLHQGECKGSGSFDILTPLLFRTIFGVVEDPISGFLTRVTSRS